MSGLQATLAAAAIAASPTLIFLEAWAAAFLFARKQPRRRNPFACAAGAAVAMFALAFATLVLTMRALEVAPSTAGPISSAAGSVQPTAAINGALVLCALELVAVIPTLRASFDMSVWAATYCATTGYVLQNLASGAGEALLLTFGWRPTDLPSMLVTLASCAVVYALTWALFVRCADFSGLSDMEGRSNRVMILGVAAVVLGVIGFDLLLKYVIANALSLGVALCLRAFHALVCVFIIAAETELVVVRQLTAEKAAAERLLAERERQYDLSRANIEAINIKCHDLRHQIRHLADGGAAVDPAVLADVAREVNVYDSLVRTGNEALDTILTEKSLLCEQRGITLTCVADGAALGFMAAADLYALFGNALDNAIEAVGALDEPELRSVSLIVRERAGMVSLHVENYCAANVRFDGGSPVSTKGDDANHGFGTRSMRAIVERYGGTIAFSADGRTFCVDALIPRE